MVSEKVRKDSVDQSLDQRNGEKARNVHIIQKWLWSWILKGRKRQNI